jgi:hypothetical protein
MPNTSTSVGQLGPRAASEFGTGGVKGDFDQHTPIRIIAAPNTPNPTMCTVAVQSVMSQVIEIRYKLPLTTPSVPRIAMTDPIILRVVMPSILPPCKESENGNALRLVGE